MQRQGTYLEPTVCSRVIVGLSVKPSHRKHETQSFYWGVNLFSLLFRFMISKPYNKTASSYPQIYSLSDTIQRQDFFNHDQRHQPNKRRNEASTKRRSLHLLACWIVMAADLTTIFSYWINSPWCNSQQGFGSVSSYIQSYLIPLLAPSSPKLVSPWKRTVSPCSA